MIELKAVSQDEVIVGIRREAAVLLAKACDIASENVEDGDVLISEILGHDNIESVISLYSALSLGLKMLAAFGMAWSHLMVPAQEELFIDMTSMGIPMGSIVVT